MELAVEQRDLEVDHRLAERAFLKKLEGGCSIPASVAAVGLLLSLTGERACNTATA